MSKPLAVRAYVEASEFYYEMGGASPAHYDLWTSEALCASEHPVIANCDPDFRVHYYPVRCLLVQDTPEVRAALADICMFEQVEDPE